MSEITHHHKPYPQTTDQGGPTSTCSALCGAWLCTRVAGHTGDHQAGGTRGQMYASWTREEKAS